MIAANCLSLASFLLSLLSGGIAFSALGFSIWNAGRERRHRESSQLAGMLLNDKIAQLNGFYYPLQGGLARLWSFKLLILDYLNKSPKDLIGSPERSDPRLLDLFNEISANDDAKRVMERLVAVQRELLESVLVKGGFIQEPDLLKMTQDLQLHFEGFGIAWAVGTSDTMKRFQRYPQGLDEKIRVTTDRIEREITDAREAAAGHLRLLGTKKSPHRKSPDA